MTRGVFVTGTDTGVGKTLASAALLIALRARGAKAVGMKPIASGCRREGDALRNDDAEALIDASDPTPDYALCNPYAFEPPIAPHVAAAEAGVTIDLGRVRAAYATLARDADAIVVEGVGGWCVPLGANAMLADLPRALDLPVVLVVGMRLGCINHALLSARAIVADGCRLIGWIASRVDPNMSHANATLRSLRERLPAPMLGELPYAPNATARERAPLLDVAEMWLM